MRSWLALIPAILAVTVALWTVPDADPGEMLRAAIRAKVCTGDL